MLMLQLKLIRKHQPDVVCMQEVTRACVCRKGCTEGTADCVGAVAAQVHREASEVFLCSEELHSFRC